MLMRARIDADDPQLSEIALFVLAIAVRVLPTALDVFLGGLPQLAPGAKGTAGGLHHLLFALQARDVRSNAWHWSIPLGLKQAFDVPGFARRLDDRGLPEAALSLRRFLGQDVTLERSHTLHLSGSGDLEALSGALVRLHFRH
jgi:hypothetical protein